MARKKSKKPLSPPAKLALAQAEHARAKKALDKAAVKLDACQTCNQTSLERELEVLAKKHGASVTNLKRAVRGEEKPSKPAKTAKRRAKKRATTAAPAATSKKTSKKVGRKTASKKSSSKKRSSKKIRR